MHSLRVRKNIILTEAHKKAVMAQERFVALYTYLPWCMDFSSFVSLRHVCIHSATLALETAKKYVARTFPHPQCVVWTFGQSGVQSSIIPILAIVLTRNDITQGRGGRGAATSVRACTIC